MVTGQSVALIHGKRALHVDSREHNSLHNFHLRSDQDIFHQTLADPHCFEGEVKTTISTDTEGIAFSMSFQNMTKSILPQIYLMVMALQILPKITDSLVVLVEV